MVTHAAQNVSRQQLHRSSPQCFLLPLATKHKQLLLLLLTEGLAVAYLKKKQNKKRVKSKASVLKVGSSSDENLLTSNRTLSTLVNIRKGKVPGPAKQRQFLTPTFASYVSTLRP